MRKRLIELGVLALLGLCAGWAIGQTPTHSVSLTITEADSSATNPGTATIYRASGSCPASGVPSGATALSSTVSVPGTGTYTDTSVTAGSTYCYYATVKVGGAVSPNSNTFQGAITIAVPALSGSVQ